MCLAYGYLIYIIVYYITTTVHNILLVIEFIRVLDERL